MKVKKKDLHKELGIEIEKLSDVMQYLRVKVMSYEVWNKKPDLLKAAEDYIKKPKKKNE